MNMVGKETTVGRGSPTKVRVQHTVWGGANQVVYWLGVSPRRWGWIQVRIPHQAFWGLIVVGTVNIWCITVSNPVPSYTCILLSNISIWPGTMIASPLVCCWVSIHVVKLSSIHVGPAGDCQLHKWAYTCTAFWWNISGWGLVIVLLFVEECLGH